MRQLPLVAIILMALSQVAQAAELTLFDIPLRTASRDQIRSAISEAGGRLQSRTRDTDVFDASRIGLPGAQQLEVVFLQDKLVLAQYHLHFQTNADEERLRKMLVAKYGVPTKVSVLGSWQISFGDEYVGDGKFAWKFDGDMSLVATKEFAGGFDLLTYVNRTEQARLESIVKAQDGKAVEHEANAKKSIF